MSGNYDNTNSGALFGTANQRLVRAGTVDADGVEERLAIILTETKSGKTVFEVYQKVGAIFTNDKNSENSPDVSGTILINGDEYQMAGWKRESQRGVPYTSVALTPKQQEPEHREPDQPEPQGALDDDIPF